MNQQQRKRISQAVADLSPFAEADHVLEVGKEALLAAVSAASSVFEEIAEEEREKFDNMPEGLQQGERAQAMEEAADALESAVSDLGDIDDNIDFADEDSIASACDSVQSAIGNAESF